MAENRIKKKELRIKNNTTNFSVMLIPPTEAGETSGHLVLFGTGVTNLKKKKELRFMIYDV